MLRDRRRGDQPQFTSAKKGHLEIKQPQYTRCSLGQFLIKFCKGCCASRNSKQATKGPGDVQHPSRKRYCGWNVLTEFCKGAIEFYSIPVSFTATRLLLMWPEFRWRRSIRIVVLFIALRWWSVGNHEWNKSFAAR